MILKQLKRYISAILVGTIVFSQATTIAFAESSSPDTSDRTLTTIGMSSTVNELSLSKTVADPLSLEATSMEEDDDTDPLAEKTLCNLLFFIRFADEKEYVGPTDMGAGDIPKFELVENSYNRSIYSLREYYRAVTNHTCDVKTVYLSAEAGEMASFELTKPRGYYSPYDSKKNPDGYHTLGEREIRRSELVRDWTAKVQKRIDEGAVLQTAEHKRVDFSKLDNNGDGMIDSITIMMPEDSKYPVNGNQDVLWSYQNRLDNISVRTPEGKKLRGTQYYQTTLKTDENSVYNDGTMYFTNPSIFIHEMGHIFGLRDLYKGGVIGHFMSPMARPLSPVVQFFTAAEREAMGWLKKENIQPITEAGTYSIQPMSHDPQTGVMVYTLAVNEKKKLYLEYRYRDDNSINRFDYNQRTES